MSIGKTNFSTNPNQDSKNKYEDVNNLTNDNTNNLIGVLETQISVADIAYIYEGVKMGENVLKKIIEAHNEVLTHGLTKGTEMVVAIDLSTGETVAKAYGTETATKFSYEDKNYQGKAVTIHNHTSSGSFTPTDLVTFSRDVNSHMSVIQAHNGKIYSLQKLNEVMPF